MKGGVLLHPASFPIEFDSPGCLSSLTALSYVLVRPRLKSLFFGVGLEHTGILHVYAFVSSRRHSSSTYTILSLFLPSLKLDSRPKFDPITSYLQLDERITTTRSINKDVPRNLHPLLHLRPRPHHTKYVPPRHRRTLSLRTLWHENHKAHRQVCRVFC